MELNSLNSKKNLQYESIREVKVPLDKAIELTKNNGLDEVFFKAGGKDYVAYGKGMDLKSLKGNIPATFKDMNAKIIHIDNEVNTVKEGAVQSIKSGYKTVLGISGLAGGVAGGASGLASIVLNGSSAAKSFLQFGLPVAGIGLAISGAAVMTYGAVKAKLSKTDYSSIEKITKQNNPITKLTETKVQKTNELKPKTIVIPKNARKELINNLK